jgi:hypothetical protein
MVLFFYKLYVLRPKNPKFTSSDNLRCTRLSEGKAEEGYNRPIRKSYLEKHPSNKNSVDVHGYRI